MLILMKPEATEADIAEVMGVIQSLGFAGHRIPGAQRIAIGITGNQGAIDPAHFVRVGGVAEAVAVSKPFKLVSREVKVEDTAITLQAAGGAAAQFGGD